MDRTIFRRPPQWWAPKLSPGWVRFWKPLRRYIQYKSQRLDTIEIRGLENLREPLARNQGLLITPNHSGHPDATVLYRAAEQLGMPFYFMSAWQVFGRSNWLRKKIFQHHGCFSVDREGTDMQAFRQATDILKNKSHPLVIFPEGEVYHINERVTPFREGPAAMALSASKKADRPIVCVPCGIRYKYIEDPTPELLLLMDKLENHIDWRSRSDEPLPQRIYRLAQAVLALKEIEYLGHTQNMELSERVTALSVAILKQWEESYQVDPKQHTIPERVKALRQEAIKRLEDADDESPQQDQSHRALEDLYIVVQLFSYPGDYVSESPTVERMAETLDKFEEDVLGARTATVRGRRRAIVTFGQPITAQRNGETKLTPVSLTTLLEQHVQTLLDQTNF